MSKDLTKYCKALGYQGSKKVIVSNGLVISHRNQDWLLFCSRLREQVPNSGSDENIIHDNYKAA